MVGTIWSVSKLAKECGRGKGESRWAASLAQVGGVVLTSMHEGALRPSQCAAAPGDLRSWRQDMCFSAPLRRADGRESGVYWGRLCEQG